MTSNRHTAGRRPNDRTQRAAAKLLGIAPDITRAIEHIREELSAIGYPSNGGGPKVSGGEPGNAVEMQAVKAARYSAQREDLRDQITACEDHVSALVRLVKHILGETMPNADGEALCADKQRGRDGVIDWGDPTCTELPTQGGLCFRCYQAERRWRSRTGLPDRAEPAA